MRHRKNFYDNTSDAMSGHFTVNGVVQAANTTFGLTAAQLAQTTFTAGSISDDLFANVNDGFAFSGPKEFHVVVPPNHAPVLTAPDYSPTGQVIAPRHCSRRAMPTTTLSLTTSMTIRRPLAAAISRSTVWCSPPIRPLA